MRPPVPETTSHKPPVSSPQKGGRHVIGSLFRHTTTEPVRVAGTGCQDAELGDGGLVVVTTSGPKTLVIDQFAHGLAEVSLDLGDLAQASFAQTTLPAQQ